MIKEKVRLVFSDLKKNSYKYWDGELFEDGRVISTYGVVGARNPQTNDYGLVGESFFRKKIREKEKKGYTHAKVLIENGTAKPIHNISLADIAIKQIKISNKSLEPLIARLANSNVHKITSSTSINFDNGVFQTPLGIVTQEGITEARVLLDWFFKNVKSNGKDAYNERIDQYLRIIPRPKGRGLLYEEVFPNTTTIQKESDVLDALENSLTLALTNKNDAEPETEARIFDLEMSLLTDQKQFKKIQDWYNNTNRGMHGYTGVKIINIYEVDLINYNSNFRKSDNNVVEVWHGTGQSNILSILKSGLFISPPSTAAIAGKMFGNGVYGSQTASKSLGYSMGRWGQGKGDNGWLFVCNFAMGKAYYPTTYGMSKIPAEYDSCWALPAKTGLYNDELIVYNENQIQIKYLLELK